MTLRYFGTDGVRGAAYESPLTLEEVARWGAAWAEVALAEGVTRFFIGWDPRTSSEPMAEAFRRGFGAAMPVVVLGMVPTPAVAWTVAQATQPAGDKAWGLMISASHNPPADNGLKGFNEKGEKLSEAQEEAVEAAFERRAGAAFPEAPAAEAGSIEPFLAHLGGLDLPADLPVVLDCAHGATADAARRLFRGPGAHFIATPADGARINVGVGSTHLEALQAEVKAKGAAFGLAFDGDGDRCLMVDHDGEVLDGDQMLWLLAQDRVLTKDAPAGVVGTVMSNGALEQSLTQLGIRFVRTPVGDKFLLRELGAKGWDLAAEASGHVIQKRVGPSGDGLATGLSVLRALLHRPAHDRFSWRFEPWPQRLVNVVAKARRPVEACPKLQATMAALTARWDAGIRQVIRWSGTEPKLRLMVEAREQAWVDQALQELEAAAREDLALS